MPQYRVPAYKCVLVRERSVLLDKQINSTAAAIELAKRELGNSPNEQLIAFALDVKCRVIGQHTVTVGTLDASLAHPREIFRAAIILNASSVIIAHNHPSGDLVPSRQDCDVFERLKKSGDLIGIQLLDSIIVSDNDGMSMAQSGY
jgi:DNA repair protein RadC